MKTTIVLLLWFLVAVSTSAQSPPKLSSYEVNDGPYAGAYRVADGGRIDWYFANLGLRFFVDDAAYNARIGTYLDVFLAKLNPVTLTILNYDYAPAKSFCGESDAPGKAEIFYSQPHLMCPDSNDSYAATFVSLAVAWARTGHPAWWASNQIRILDLVRKNLLEQRKANGLIATCHRVCGSVGQVYTVGLLMDNSEDYAALKDLGGYLNAAGRGEGDPYLSAARDLGAAIHRELYKSILNSEPRSGWLWNDTQDVPANAGKWYPDCTAPMFPALYDVRSLDAAGDWQRLRDGYSYLERQQVCRAWESNFLKDDFPWYLIGYAVALREGQPGRARNMVENGGPFVKLHPDRLTINELGYATKILSLAQKGPGCTGPCTF